MNRRKFIALTGLSTLPSISFAKEKKQTFESIAAEFMEKYNVSGFSVAFAYKGEMKRVSAFGLAKPNMPLETTHTFRIASVSKPITAVGILKLIEQKKLQLNTPIFGKSGVLDYAGNEGISVHHLLNHTCGGWGNKRNDPMFQKIKLNHDDLIKWTIKNNKLKNRPGENYEYSNFGYCLLGRVIEKLTSQSYENFISDNVLNPCGINQMFIGQEEPNENEVDYFDNQSREISYPMNISRMDAHGGWVGTPTEMVKFGIHVDGFGTPKDILSADSLKTMVRIKESKSGYGYACGWSVNKYGNYWHMGSLPGLTSILVRTKSGYCWSACANTRTKGIALAMDRLMWKLSKHI